MHLGIDIASVDSNKLVDWKLAVSAGVQFAYFRASYKLWADSTWREEAGRARQAGVLPGAYLFPVMDKNALSAAEQVKAFRSSCGNLEKNDLPPALDIEFPGGIAKTGRSQSELIAWIQEAIAELTLHFGFSPVLYTSGRVWDGQDSDSLNSANRGFPECPLWLARYPYKTQISPVIDPSTVDALALPPVPKAWGEANDVWIHQYQGDAVKLPGFTATEDLNRFFELKLGDHGERVKWTQRRLRITTDGIFGLLTEHAIKLFQSDKLLPASGIVDPVTFANLCRVKL